MPWRYFTTTDGLRENWTGSVSIGADGMVWCKHGEVDQITGLDGYQVYHIPSPGWHTDWDRKLREGPNRQIWARYPQGLQSFINNRWVSFLIPDFQTSTEPLFIRRVNHFIPVAQDRVLYLLPERLMEFNSGTNSSAEILSSKRTGLGNFIHLERSHEGKIWITCERGLVQFIGLPEQITPTSEWKAYALDEASPFRNLRHPNEGNPGEWLTVADRVQGPTHALLSFNGQNWQTLIEDTHNIIRGWRGEDNHFWMQTGEGLFTIQNGQKIPVEREESLAGTLFDVAAESGGNFWIATSLGLVRYAPAIWREPEIAREINMEVLAVHENPVGTFWFACREALVQYKDGKLKRYPPPKGGSFRPFPHEALCFLPNGRIAIRKDGVNSSLLLFNPQTEQYEYFTHPNGRGIGEIAYRHDGTLWIQTIKPTENSDYDIENFALEIFDGNHFQMVLDLENQWNLKQLLCIFEAQNGDVWLGGLTGLGLYNKQKYRAFSPQDGYTGAGAFCIQEISKGTIWVGGRNEILEYRGNRWSLVRSDLQNVWSILKSHDDTLWVASAGGLHRCWEGQWITNTIEDGLPNTTAYRVFEDSKNRIWVRTAKGLSIYHPEADIDSPETFIRQEENSNSAPATGDVRMEFHGVDRWKYTPANRLLYTYRFDGGEWSPVAAGTVVFATGMAVGAHRFEVRAIDRNWNADPTPAQFKFFVLAPWYKTGGFIVILIAAIFFIILTLGYIASRYLWMEKLVSTRTAELAASNRSLMNEISERYRVEVELAKRQAIYRSLVENLQQCIFMKDVDLNFVSANTSFCNLLQRPLEQIIGKNDFDFFPENLAAKYREDDRRVMESDQIVHVVEEHQTQEGLKWVEVVKTPVKDAEGRVTGLLGIFWDVTDRKRAEEVLRENENRYRTLYNHTPVMLYSSDREGNLISVSDYWLETMGYEREEVIGRKAYEFMTEASQVLARDSVQPEFLKKGYCKNIEYQFVKKNGEVFDALLSAIVEKDSYGSMMRSLAVITDISERKRMEEALRHSEERFRLVFQTTPDAVCINRLDNAVFVDVNEGFEALSGYRREEVIGKTSWDVNLWSNPEDRQRLSLTLKQDGVVRNMEFKFRLKDGRCLVGLVSANLITLNGIPHILTLTRDIESLKKAEEALAAEKELLAVTLRSIGDGVITTDQKGNVVLLNKIAESMTGWREEEAIGKPLEKIFHIIHERTRKVFTNPVKKVLETGEIVTLSNHTVLVHRDGSERVIADSGAPIRDRNSNILGVVLVFRDVTDKKIMETERLKSQKLESVGVLAGGIAHDFNNILTAILGYISLAKVSAEPQSKVFELLNEAELASQQASDLTQQLLTFSKGGAPVKQAASLAEIVRDTAAFALRGSNVRCECSVPDDLWTVEIDRGQISQVIQNLIINADQAMPNGGTIRTSIENVWVDGAEVSLIPSLHPGQYVKLSVEDEGVGIPEENLSKIFDPYFTTKQKGNGLGLAISYSIMDKHEGAITVKSTVGEGTVFSLYLPATSQKGPIVKVQEAEPLHCGIGKILVMDDDRNIRNVAGLMLKHLGYHAEFVQDGVTAIERYKQAKESGDGFDVVIMDLTIPGGMGGKEAVELLLDYDPQAKAIVSSGYSTAPIMAEYKKYGFTGVIVKPYKINELSSTLRRIMDGKNESHTG